MPFYDARGTIIGDSLSDNKITGYGPTDYLVARGGSDELFGGNGNDVLELIGGGGTSHTLRGEGGNDVYLLGSAAVNGSHIISSFDGVNPGGGDAGDDRLIINADIVDPSSISLSKDGDNLVINYGTGLITVLHHFRNYGLADSRNTALDRIEFRNFHYETDYSEVIPSLSWDKVIYGESEPLVVWNQQYIAEAVGLGLVWHRRTPDQCRFGEYGPRYAYHIELR